LETKKIFDGTTRSPEKTTTALAVRISGPTEPFLIHRKTEKRTATWDWRLFRFDKRQNTHFNVVWTGGKTPISMYGV